MPSRRRALTLLALGAGAPWIGARLAFASVATEQRFVFVIQRGAADGLDIVRPVGDPAYATLRRSLAGHPSDAIALDPMFALHPSLPALGAMYRSGQALFVHAVASPYRDRSHFDGQNVLETGGVRPYAVSDGWLNRLVAMLPRTAAQPIAFAPTVPVALRGRQAVTSYAPSSMPPPPDDLMVRVGALYDRDPSLHRLWAAALQASSIDRATSPDGASGPSRQDPDGTGRLAATFLARPDGPRIAMIETEGWDTHIAQATRLAGRLAALDHLLASLRDGLGPLWRRTTVLVATEFGRTAAENGTGGTDHGTGAVAMLAGGSVRGGRVLADWPGLAPARLYQDRDLRPTASLDDLIAGAAGEALGVDPGRVARQVFHPTGATRPMSGLIAT